MRIQKFTTYSAIFTAMH